jgi:hypothetical protein
MGVVQTIVKSIPILSGVVDFAGIFWLPNPIGEILTFRLFQ